MGEGELRVLICDARLLVTDALTGMLAAESDIDIVGVADSGIHAMMLIHRHEPDLVLAGLELYDVSGLDLARRMRSDPVAGRTPVILIGVDNSDAMLAEALQAGVDGVLADDVSPVELVLAIRAVVDGNAMLSATAARRLLTWFRTAEEEPDGAGNGADSALTNREREVLSLAARGLSTEDIASRLQIGAATVRTHLYRTKTKLGLRDRAALVSYAYKAGLM